MKKLLILISVLLVLLLVGCSKADNTSSDLGTNSSSEIVSSVIEETASVEETVSDEITSEDTSSKNEISEVDSKTETPSKTENSSKKETSSTTNATTSNTNNNSTTMTFDKNGVPVLNPNLPYTWYEEDGVITYHQNGWHWNNKGDKWTDKDLSDWFGDQQEEAD